MSTLVANGSSPSLNARPMKPADRGGILLLWDTSFVQLSNVQSGAYILSATVALCSNNHDSTNTSFKVTIVYGPTRSNLKDAFFDELVSKKPSVGTLWLVTGYFNQIYHALDKNQANVDQSRDF
ncbi:hypothetical protein D1007_35892 [Hordeum vulgare]|nr:hypothetical protein D1007_35892 [Hordeum vulgare]